MKSLIQKLFLSCLGCSMMQAETVEMNDARDHLDQIQTFVTHKRKLLAISSQSHDIFGRPQNPQKAAEIAQTRIQAPTQKKKAQKIPMQTIVDNFSLTLMDTANNLVIIKDNGAIRAGQTIAFDYQGEPVQLKLETVRSDGAWFRDVKTRKLFLSAAQKPRAGIQRGGNRSPSNFGIKRINSKGSRSEPVRIELNQTALGQKN